MAVRKIKDGKWKAVIYVGRDPRTGKRVRKTRTFNSENEAKEEYANMVLKYKNRSIYNNENILVKDFLEKWLKQKKPKLSPTTYRGYHSIVYSHLIPHFGYSLVKDIKPYHIQDYIEQKRTDGKLKGSGGLSEQSLTHHYNVLNNVFKKAKGLKIIDDNPCDSEALEKPKPDNKPGQPFTRKEVAKLLKIAKGYDWLYPIIYIALFTGMRRGEIAGLKWKDINFRNKIIQVNRSAVRVIGTGIVYKEPKTETSKRIITIDDRDKSLLKEIRKEQMKNSKYVKEEDLNNKLVFPMRDGSPTDPDIISRRFKRFLNKHKLTDHSFHDLRHTHTTLLFEAGEKLKAIQERLGHASAATTLDIYTHLMDNIQKETPKKLKQHLRNIPL